MHFPSFSFYLTEMLIDFLSKLILSWLGVIKRPTILLMAQFTKSFYFLHRCPFIKSKCKYKFMTIMPTFFLYVYASNFLSHNHPTKYVKWTTRKGEREISIKKLPQTVCKFFVLNYGNDTRFLCWWMEWSF